MDGADEFFQMYNNNNRKYNNFYNINFPTIDRRLMEYYIDNFVTTWTKYIRNRYYWQYFPNFDLKKELTKHLRNCLKFDTFCQNYIKCKLNYLRLKL